MEGQRKPFVPAPQYSDNIVSVNDTGGKDDRLVDYQGKFDDKGNVEYWQVFCDICLHL